MNNYDSNSEHDSIDISVLYDIDLTQIRFDDFCNEYTTTRIRFTQDSDIFLIGDATKSFYTISQLNKMKKSELIELDDKYQLLCPYNYDDTTKAELIEELQSVSIKTHYEYLTEHYNWNNIRDNFAHDYYISQGYSQGDAIYVIKLDEIFTQQYEKYIDHIFWDNQIDINIEVNGVEYSNDELLDDCYVYDKTDVITKLNQLDISDYAKQWIAENLPNEPSDY